jgi:hypothetical protein
LLGLADVGEGGLGQGEVVPAVALYVALYGEEVLAFYVRREEADAEFLSYEQGGHLLLLQLDDVREKVAAFHERHIGGA